jgi:hypothetical protein
MKNCDSFRFSIQFNLKNENHQRAYEILNRINKGSKSEFCIDCILSKKDEKKEIRNLIEATIKECLEDTQISVLKSEEIQNHDDGKIEIMDGVLDFMNGF